MIAQHGRVVVTSLPPSITRRDSAGAEVGEAWQRRCIESWLHLADSVVSVNPPSELDRMMPRPHVRYVRAGQDDGPPKLTELLAAGVATGARELLLVNSDVALGEHRPWRARDTAGVRVGRRLTIEDPDDAEGVPYLGGYDTFALPAHLAERIVDAGFVLGRPWWDYWLPLAGVVAGEQLGPLEFTVHHLAHPTRWSHESYMAFGDRFVHWLATRDAANVRDLVDAVSAVSVPRGVELPLEWRFRQIALIVFEWLDSACGLGSVVTEDGEHVRYDAPRGWLDMLADRGERMVAAGFDAAKSWFGPDSVPGDAGSGSASVRTPAVPWSYSAVLALDSATAIARAAVLVVEVKVVEGTIGIGLLNAAESDFLFRRPLTVTEKTQEVWIPISDPHAVGRLVLQTWEAPEPGAVELLSMRLFN